jgi:solute carrier family 25 phosphate transporter 3
MLILDRGQVGTLTAGQFAIYGDIKKALGATGGVEISK